MFWTAYEQLDGGFGGSVQTSGDQLVHVCVKNQADVRANDLTVSIGIVIDTEAPIHNAIAFGIYGGLRNRRGEWPFERGYSAASAEAGITIGAICGSLARNFGAHQLGGLQDHWMRPDAPKRGTQRNNGAHHVRPQRRGRSSENTAKAVPDQMDRSASLSPGLLDGVKQPANQQLQAFSVSADAGQISFVP